MHWRPEDMDRLERAISDGDRVQLMRRGTEYVVVPRRIVSDGSAEVLVGTTATGDDLRFQLDEIERFVVLF
jgi:predicted DNA-binding transcriptional regulator YafY